MQIAIFDLDGTITRRDTLLPFVWGWLAQKPWQLFRLVRVLPALLKFALGTRDPGELKSALLQQTLRGAARADVSAWAQHYVRTLLNSGIFQQALSAIRSHRNGGDYLVLMSASVDLYVPQIGEALGFSQTICSRVRWDEDRLDGRLSSANCRGSEKLRYLQQLRTEKGPLRVVAYGNSSPDLAHLEAADQGYLVNGGLSLQRRAQRAGIQCVSWK